MLVQKSDILEPIPKNNFITFKLSLNSMTGAVNNTSVIIYKKIQFEVKNTYNQNQFLTHLANSNQFEKPLIDYSDEDFKEYLGENWSDSSRFDSRKTFRYKYLSNKFSDTDIGLTKNKRLENMLLLGKILNLIINFFKLLLNLKILVILLN